MTIALLEEDGERALAREASIQVVRGLREEGLLVQVLRLEHHPVLAAGEIIPKGLAGVVPVGDIFERGTELIGRIVAAQTQGELALGVVEEQEGVKLVSSRTENSRSVITSPSIVVTSSTPQTSMETRSKWRWVYSRISEDRSFRSGACDSRHNVSGRNRR
jgi:hypothetical protein